MTEETLDQGLLQTALGRLPAQASSGAAGYLHRRLYVVGARRHGRGGGKDPSGSGA